MKLISFKINFKSRLINFYENWILPPQNETLLELKKREFREKTKYLKPEVFYGLSEEEKRELRNEGYIVDLDKTSINKVRNFHLTYNRHQGRYQYYNNDYNQMIYQTKYYYADQEENLFLGDENFRRKMWRRRSAFKRQTGYLAIFICFVFIHSIFHQKKHRKLRNYHQKLYEENFDFKEFQDLKSLLKMDVEGNYEEIYLNSLTEGYKASIVLRTDHETTIKNILDALNEFKKNLIDKNFKVCFIVLLSEEYYKSNASKLIEKYNTEKYDQIRNISFFTYDYRKEDLKEKGLYYFMQDSLSILDKNSKGYWGTKCNLEKLEINNFQFKMNIGNLAREEALKLSKANYLNI